ncbi:hypothetical protein [Streptomyces sp. NPDC018584]|uniref:hypothetical protein n=1 Tax=unclassified Streptomyces TaxID=2593676 RepID=UPI00378D99EF
MLERGGAPSLSSSRRSDSTRRCSSSTVLLPFTTAVNSSKAMFDKDRPVRLRSQGIMPSPVNHRHTLSISAKKASRHAKAGNDMSQIVTTASRSSRGQGFCRSRGSSR